MSPPNPAGYPRAHRYVPPDLEPTETPLLYLLYIVKLDVAVLQHPDRKRRTGVSGWHRRRALETGWPPSISSVIGRYDRTRRTDCWPTARTWPRSVARCRSEEHTSELQSRENLVC